MRTNKRVLVLLCSVVVFASFPLTVSADIKSDTGEYSTKDEVIYGNLHASGSLKNMYVVNTFRITKQGDIVDYGDYTDIRNLTDLSEVTQTNNQVHFQADAEAFYYQGELENQPLPWDISITYLVNDKEVNPDELAGKTGHLEIQVTTSANKKVNPVFFEYYLLQISLTLDPLIFKNIQAPEGTEANEGKNKNITFSIMPEQEEELIISADVTNMEMDPIDISAVPANIAMEDPDITGMSQEMQKLADGIKEVNAGVKELHGGISELKDGATGLSSGSNAFKDGINELDGSSDELIAGSKQILDVIQKVSDALKDSPDIGDLENVDDLKELPKELRDAANEIRDFSKGLDQLNEAMDSLPDGQISDEQMEQVLDALKDSGADKNMTNIVQQLQDINKETQVEIDIPDNATSIMTEMADQLDSLADDIEDGMNNMEQLGDLADLQAGLTSMSTEYETFHNGLVDYTEGVHQLAVSYQKIDSGIAELSGGTSSLERGADELQQGTQELEDATSNLPGEMQSEIDELMEEYDFSDFQATSFVSDKNEDIDVVQFVLQTENIELTEPETTTKEATQKNLRDRFLDLFK